MKILKRFAVLTGVALMLSLGGPALAQPGGFGGGGFPNMDPQQMQAMMQQLQTMDPQQLQDMAQQFQSMDPQQMQATMQEFMTMDPQQMQKTLEQRSTASLREQMGITSDTEWSLIDEKIKAVTKARAAVAADGTGAMGMGGLLGGLRGGLGGGRGGALAGAASRLTPEAKALQAAIDANAPAGEIKNLMAALREAREAKHAALVKAQGELRALLAFRQEVVAILRGVLD